MWSQNLQICVAFKDYIYKIKYYLNYNILISVWIIGDPQRIAICLLCVDTTGMSCNTIPVAGCPGGPGWPGGPWAPGTPMGPIVPLSPFEPCVRHHSYRSLFPHRQLLYHVVIMRFGVDHLLSSFSRATGGSPIPWASRFSFWAHFTLRHAQIM